MVQISLSIPLIYLCISLLSLTKHTLSKKKLKEEVEDMEMVNSLNIVPSPLESLDLNVNHLSYGLLTAVSSIWAWFAALTAAVSFWRIKSLSPSPPSSPAPTRGRKACRDEATEPSIKTDGPACGSPPSPSTKKIATAKATPFYHAMDGECSSPKVKFSVCYRGESREYGNRDIDGRDFNDCKENGSNVNICNKDRALRYCDNMKYGDDWKRMTVVRMGDMGWYTWQDISVLDGSVVRLWDVRRGPTNSAVRVVAGDGCW